MSESLRLQIVYEEVEDGWIGVRIPQVPGAISQGKTREEARENVIDALREILAYRFGEPPKPTEGADERIAAVPRHREINTQTARAVCKDLGIPPPRGR